MAFTPIRKAEVDAFVPEYWADSIFNFMMRGLELEKTVTIEKGLAKAGDVYREGRLSELGVNSYVEGTEVNLQRFVETQYQLVIDQYKEVSIGITDLAKKQANVDYFNAHTSKIGYYLGLDIDNAILGQRAALMGAGQFVNATAALTENDILAARTMLATARIPLDQLWLIVSPLQMAQLLKIPGFTSGDYVTGKPLETGTVPRVYGMPVLVSNNITINSLTGFINGKGATPGPTPGMTGSLYYPSQFDTAPVSLTAGRQSGLLVHKEWLKLAMQKQPNVEHDRDVMRQSDIVVSTQIYGLKLYRPEAAVVLNSI